MIDYKIGKYALKVKRARLGSGLGLFAEEDIPKGKFVIEYIGRELTEREKYTSRSKYLFEINDKITIDGGISENLAGYINHSCRPNCEAEVKRGKIMVSSIKKIKKGDELTYDYGKEFFDTHIKPHGCKCIKCLKL